MTQTKHDILTSNLTADTTSQRFCIFYFLPTLNFLIQFLMPRSNGTLSFAPAAQADPSAKAKEPFLPTLFNTLAR